jgi:hypothetical protein
VTFEELRRVRWRDVTSFHMDELRALAGGRCQQPGCGAKDSGVAYWNGPRLPLEFAHVKPTGLCGQGRGLKHRFLDVLRNPECYALLCRRCHRRLDATRSIERPRAPLPNLVATFEAR